MRLLASLSLVLIATGCVEDITSSGACPDFCPSMQIEIVDTVITGSIVQDSSYRGYVETHRAQTMQVTSGGVAESHGLIRFRAFAEEFDMDTSSAVDLRPIIAVDSFGVSLVVDAVAGGTADFDLVVHRLPVDIDSTVEYSDLQSTFADSAELAVASFADVVADDTVTVILPSDAFPTLDEDSSISAVGVSLRSVEPAFVDFETVNVLSTSVSMTRFLQVDSADGQAAARTDLTYPAFDSFVFSDLPVAGPSSLVVGGSPSSRAFLGISLPSWIVDSASIVRATLQLVPSEPVVGAPGDSIRLLAEGIAAEIGPKSPILQVSVDSIAPYSGLAMVGSSDTLRIDITHVVTLWGTNTSAVRGVLLRAVREAGSMGEFRFNSSESAFGSPSIHVTLVPHSVSGN